MTLQHEMRQLLAEMTLLSYGSVQSWNASGGSESPGRPGGEAWPLADKWHAEFQRNPSRETLDAARAELVAWKRRAAPADGDGSTEDDWILSQGEGYAADEVSKRFRVTPTHVRRLRVANDRDAEFGRETQTLVPSASKETRVALLTERGLSSRQVADQVGLHKTQVLRILARSRNGA